MNYLPLLLFQISKSPVAIQFGYYVKDPRAYRVVEYIYKEIEKYGYYMVEEVNDYKCATCLIELEKYLIMRKYSLARHLAEYGDNYRRCEKSRDLYGQYDEIEKILKEIEKYHHCMFGNNDMCAAHLIQLYNYVEECKYNYEAILESAGVLEN